MNGDLISIIVPVYKVEKYLSRCLESIVNQTYKNLEIILIDDGSPDNSGKICDEYAEKDSRIKVIHKENSGVSSTRNLGLKKATGDYISFIDSDDWIEFDMYEKMIEVINKENVDLVKCSYIYEYDESSKKIENLYSESKCIDLKNNKKSYIDFIFEGNTLPAMWTFLIKRERIDEISLKFDENLIVGEDLIFVLNLICHCNSIYILNEHLYHYFIHEQSAMNSKEKMVRNARNFLSLYTKMEQLFEKSNIYDEEYKEKLARYIFYRIYVRISEIAVEAKKRDIIKEFLYNDTFKKLVKNLHKTKLSFWGRKFSQLAIKQNIVGYYGFCYIYEFLKKCR